MRESSYAEKIIEKEKGRLSKQLSKLKPNLTSEDNVRGSTLKKYTDKCWKCALNQYRGIYGGLNESLGDSLGDSLQEVLMGSLRRQYKIVRSIAFEHAIICSDFPNKQGFPHEAIREISHQENLVRTHKINIRHTISEIKHLHSKGAHTSIQPEYVIDHLIKSSKTAWYENPVQTFLKDFSSMEKDVHQSKQLQQCIEKLPTQIRDLEDCIVKYEKTALKNDLWFSAWLYEENLNLDNTPNSSENTRSRSDQPPMPRSLINSINRDLPASKLQVMTEKSDNDGELASYQLMWDTAKKSSNYLLNLGREIIGSSQLVDNRYADPYNPPLNIGKSELTFNNQAGIYQQTTSLDEFHSSYLDLAYTFKEPLDLFSPRYQNGLFLYDKTVTVKKAQQLPSMNLTKLSRSPSYKAVLQDDYSKTVSNNIGYDAINPVEQFKPKSNIDITGVMIGGGFGLAATAVFGDVAITAGATTSGIGGSISISFGASIATIALPAAIAAAAAYLTYSFIQRKKKYKWIKNELCEHKLNEMVKKVESKCLEYGVKLNNQQRREIRQQYCHINEHSEKRRGLKLRLQKDWTGHNKTEEVIETQRKAIDQHYAKIGTICNESLTYLKKGCIAISRQEYQEAINVLNKCKGGLIGKNLDCAITVLGAAYMELSKKESVNKLPINPSELLSLADNIINSSASSSIGYRLRAMVNASKGTSNGIKKAIKDNINAIKNEPTNIHILNDLMEQSALVGEFQEAYKYGQQYQALIKSTNINFTHKLNYLKFTHLMQKGKLGEVVKEASLVLKKNPKNQQALSFRAKAYLLQSKISASIKDFELLVNNKCKDLDVLSGYAQSLMMKQQYTKSKNVLKNALGVATESIFHHPENKRLQYDVQELEKKSRLLEQTIRKTFINAMGVTSIDMLGITLSTLMNIGFRYAHYQLFSTRHSQTAINVVQPMYQSYQSTALRYYIAQNQVKKTFKMKPLSYYQKGNPHLFSQKYESYESKQRNETSSGAKLHKKDGAETFSEKYFGAFL